MFCQLIAKLARMFQDEQSYTSVAVIGQRCCAYCKHFALTECHASEFLSGFPSLSSSYF